MSTALQYGTLAMLLFWPMVLMTSPMMLAAPGATNNFSTLRSIILVLCYPIYIFIGYWLFDWRFFGWRGEQALVVACIVVGLCLVMFGYPQKLINLLRGIANNGYSKTATAVYFDGKRLSLVDNASFSVIPTSQRKSDFARDARQVFYRGKVIEGANPQSFRPLENGAEDYWRDDKALYHYATRLHDITPDANTQFTRLDDPFGGTLLICRDGQAGAVFLGQHVIPKADAENFEILKGGIFKDKQQVFVGTKILPGARADSFNILDQDTCYGRDEAHIYQLCSQEPGILQGAEVDSFEALPRGYARDLQRVYFRDQYRTTRILDGADPQSFEATDYDPATESDARDATHYFLNGKIIRPRK